MDNLNDNSFPKKGYVVDQYNNKLSKCEHSHDNIYIFKCKKGRGQPYLQCGDVVKFREKDLYNESIVIEVHSKDKDFVDKGEPYSKSIYVVHLAITSSVVIDSTS
jgi:hypothetical protein